MTLIDNITTEPTLLIAALALLVSVISIFTSFYGLWLQRKHNRLSVRPIGNIGTRDGVNLLSISVVNNGTGPMIIKSVEISNDQGIKKNYPIDWIPQEDQSKISFWKDLEDVALSKGNGIELFNYSYDLNNKNLVQLNANVELREKLRSILKDLTIRIKYKDIYGKDQPEFSKKLDIFGRKNFF